MGAVYFKRKPAAGRAKDEQKLPLLLLSGGFIFGIVFGCLLAASLSGGGSAALRTYITNFFLAAQHGTLGIPAFLSTLWSVFRWPLALVLLGCTAARRIGIPLLFALRGFLLSFTVCAFLLVMGRVGVLFSFLLLGLESLITIPILFLLGAEFLSKPIRRERGRSALRQWIQPSNTLGNILGLTLLFLVSIWEAYLLPIVISAAAHWFVL